MPSRKSSGSTCESLLVRRPKLPETLLNETEVAEYLKMSVASVRRWRLFRTGPKFVKIGAAVRYRRKDLETWLDSCAGLR